ncbi:membrane protein [Borreliella chilensis]|uniref:Membrane protein n=1 Tax=Borreliella chilensis TaxID=1245910 RepID=A0A0A7UXQ1_9SPIR|nr:membrane protein [Borreliella chilensis]
MFDSLRLIFLIIYRFILIFCLVSLMFICTFYLKYKFLHFNFSIFSYSLYYNSYIYSFPLSLVVTFMRVPCPFDGVLLKSSREVFSFYFIIFIFIVLFSYLGFLVSRSFNSYFIDINRNNNFILKDEVVHFLSDKIIFSSNKPKFYGFSGVLIVSEDDEKDKSFTYRSDLYDFSKIDFIENNFVDQKIYNNFVDYLFRDLKILNNFLLSLNYFNLIFNILGISLLLFAFSYVFNLIFSSSFAIFLYPIFIILFLKIYNIYSIEFPKIYNIIVGKSMVSDFIPFIFCVLTFFSTYLFGFVSEYIKISKDLDNNLYKGS